MAQGGARNGFRTVGRSHVDAVRAYELCTLCRSVATVEPNGVDAFGSPFAGVVFLREVKSALAVSLTGEEGGYHVEASCKGYEAAHEHAIGFCPGGEGVDVVCQFTAVDVAADGCEDGAVGGDDGIAHALLNAVVALHFLLFEVEGYDAVGGGNGGPVGVDAKVADGDVVVGVALYLRYVDHRAVVVEEVYVAVCVEQYEAVLRKGVAHVAHVLAGECVATVELAHGTVGGVVSEQVSAEESVDEVSAANDALCVAVGEVVSPKAAVVGAERGGQGGKQQE